MRLQNLVRGAAPYVPGTFDQFVLESGNESISNTSASTAASTVVPNTTPGSNDSLAAHPCQWILYKDINDSSVRYWDLCILIPNAIFLFFLLLRFRTAIMKLQRTNSPIFLAFYGLVFLVSIISVLRCIVSMTVNVAILAADIADQVLWLILRFFLLATELSVVVFGLAFGHLDSRTSIQRVLVVTFSVSLVYSATQGVLEFLFPDERYHVILPGEEYDIFGHGGMLFWFASSVFFTVIYSVVCLLPFTNVRRRFALPTKRSFYAYCGFLAVLNLTQAIGSGLLFFGHMQGMCVVDLTTFIYFTCFTPLVYFTFLRDFFRSSQPPSILFSYKAHLDEDDDTVNLPHTSTVYSQAATSSPTHTGDQMSAAPQTLADTNEMYDSTHFYGGIDDPNSPNPLYDSDLPPVGIRPQLTIQTEYFDGDPNDT